MQNRYEKARRAVAIFDAAPTRALGLLEIEAEFGVSEHVALNLIALGRRLALQEGLNPK